MIICGCSSNILRLPASSKIKYDPERVRLLTEMAEQGVLFQIDDDIMKDVPNVQISEFCNYVDDITWGEQFYSILKIFDRNPNLYKKIHVIHLRRGDEPKVEIEKDWDGASHLVLNYQKIQTREPNTNEWRRKCESFGEQRDQVTITKMQWPEFDQIADYLSKQPDKTKVPRFSFDTKILIYLAQRLTVFRLSPALAAEKSLDETVILPEVLNRLSSDVKEDKGKTVKFESVDAWLYEIDNKSRLGKHIKFFTSLQSQSLGSGIGIEGAERNLASSMNQSLAATYLHVSYRSRGGKYEYSSMKDLDSCLKKFNPPSHFSTKPERFMYPGHSCGDD